MPDPRPYPKVIFLDAVGTLFGVRDSVGTQYGRIARQFGAVVDDSALNRAFFNAFATAGPCAFPGVAPEDIVLEEYNWWKAIARTTLTQTGDIEQLGGIKFDDFFSRLYGYFATAEPWIIYPEVRSTLQRWQGFGIELAVISNFDTRLHRVLQTLELDRYFRSVTISSEVGAAKPNPHIFEVALHKHRCSPQDAWHIGDSYREDYLAARAVDLFALWLRR